MASSVTISNMALSHIGASARVSSISPPDGSVLAGHCDTFYAHCRQELLELGSWKFALRRVALAELSSNPSLVWGYAYALPSQCLMPRRVLQAGAKPDSESAAFTVEGETLFTDQDEAQLLYIEDVTDPTKFTAEFVSSLSFLMASYLAGPVIKGTEGARMAVAMRQMATTTAEQAAVTEANATHSVMDWKDATVVSVRQ